MEGFIKTTGKKYNEENVVKCKDCGFVYDKNVSKKCPSCGCEFSFNFQRTLATIKEENKNG